MSGSVSAGASAAVVPTPVDVPFVTFTWSRDVHYAKALLGSIRHFYPERRIIVVAEKDLPRDDVRQIGRFPNAEVIPVMDLVRRHKLHLVGLLNKLNVLFLPGVDRAIVADADSVLVDLVDAKIDHTKVFTSLNGRPSIEGDAEQVASFERWSCTLADARRLDAGFRTSPHRYVQGSHFAVNTGRFPYDFLFRMLPYLGYTHQERSLLKCGDQGFWNLLANSSCLAPDDCSVVHCTESSCAQWRDTIKPEWNSREWIEERCPKEVSFIHYIGAGRRFRRRDHVCPTPLQWGTSLYYDAVGRRAFVPDEIRRTIAPFLRNLSRFVPGRAPSA